MSASDSGVLREITYVKAVGMQEASVKKNAINSAFTPKQQQQQVQDSGNAKADVQEVSVQKSVMNSTFSQQQQQVQGSENAKADAQEMASLKQPLHQAQGCPRQDLLQAWLLLAEQSCRSRLVCTRSFGNLSLVFRHGCNVSLAVII